MKLLYLLFIAGASSANTFTYTDTQTGVNLIPLGYEVPLPIDSLTPIDGFRTYESLDLRHQQLVGQTSLFSQIQVGLTYNGRPIWAYQLSDSDKLTNSGAEEGAALINGGIHAREWQSPEALTGYMERLYEGREDQHIAQYLLENLNLVLIPVLNVDGFLQTQRFPTQVTSSEEQPRDGRMRRKNMREVDGDLDTLIDNLEGVDLNRNNSPYWATNSQRSSDDVDSIVHHGSSPASEPETQALQQAAQLADESNKLRFYIDTHSFSQIYFTPFTDNSRRNFIAQKFATVMRAANNYKYEYGPAASGGGIGSTDEYFATTYQIPSYTLEIEPLNSTSVYGGFGVSHDGFILPNAEVARMRDETAKATFSGLYAASEIPILMAIEIWDNTQNTLVLAQQWQTQNGQRSLQTSQAGELQSATDYQLKLIFNKPMRALVDGQVSSFADLSEAQGVELKLSGRNGEQAEEWPLDTAEGSWLLEQGFRQYKTDTFALDFTLAEDFNWQTLSLLSLELSTKDMVGQQLDTNPASLSAWQNGAWVNYEDTLGNTDTDTGGMDVSMRLIDDGSDLYAPVVIPPPIIPPSPGSGSGGGSLYYLLLGLILRGVMAVKFARPVV